MPVYAVTGASGHLGRFAIEQLLARGVPPSEVVAVVRDRGKATSLAGRGVTVREADYSRPETLGAALAGVNRLLLVSSSELSQLAAQHRNVITAAQTAGVSRIGYTSMLNADDSTSPLAGEHRESERALRAADVPFTLLRNGYYTEVYTDPVGQYLQAGEIVGAAGHGRISAASRQDYAAAAATALLHDSWLQRAGLDEATARFVAALDASIARGDLETSSQDLPELLGRPTTPLTEVIRAAYDAVLTAPRDNRQ